MSTNVSNANILFCKEHAQSFRNDVVLKHIILACIFKNLLQERSPKANQRPNVACRHTLFKCYSGKTFTLQLMDSRFFLIQDTLHFHLFILLPRAWGIEFVTFLHDENIFIYVKTSFQLKTVFQLLKKWSNCLGNFIYSFSYEMLCFI